MMITETTQATETESTVTIEYVEGAALHLQYRGQHKPQPVYVQLNCDTGELSAYASGEIGSGVPERVWHRRWLRWTIPALTADAANGLLDEIAVEAARIVAGYSCEWDGSNHVGHYDEDAAEAVEAVQSLCDRDWDGQTIEVWSAGDWYGGVGGHDAQRDACGISAETTDEQLAAIVEREESQASPRVIEGLERHLTMLRDEAANEADED